MNILSIAQQDPTLMTDPVIVSLETSNNSNSSNNSITTTTNNSNDSEIFSYPMYRTRRMSPTTGTTSTLSPQLYNNNNRLHSNHHLHSHSHNNSGLNNGDLKQKQKRTFIQFPNHTHHNS